MSAGKDDHYYGGQAVIEGVMMRGKRDYAVAVRRADGQIVLLREDLPRHAREGSWLQWPLLRGNYALYESLALGLKALQFSANVAMLDEREASGAAQAEPAGTKPGMLTRVLTTLTVVASLALGLGLFVLLPAWIVDLLPGSHQVGPTTKNVIEGLVRLLVIVGYIKAISLMGYVRRVFEYHGAEHATINCYESGRPVTLENCLGFSPLHPRCGTAFLLLVIVLKIIIGSFFGWPVLWLRLLLRLGMLLPIAALAYEVLRFAGRHRQSVLAQVLSYPGLLLQKLTTRRPDPDQIKTALYSLAALSPEVALPADWPLPQRVDAELNPIVEEGRSDGLAKSL